VVRANCLCGWSVAEPSKAQADEAERKHRLQCKKLSLCRICSEIALGSVQLIDGVSQFICHPCNDVHPRQGRYSFDDAGARSQVQTGRVGPKQVSHRRK
jgi:hypothetical protein